MFVPGTSVNGLGIADLTVDEAAERIGSFYTRDYTLTIKERGGKTETITGDQIGFSVKLPDGFLQEKLNQQNAAGRVFGPDVDNKYKTDMISSFQKEQLEQAGLTARYDREFFHEFVTESDTDSGLILKALEEKGILGGLPLSSREILWCATEQNRKEDMDQAVQIVKEVCGA